MLKKISLFFLFFFALNIASALFAQGQPEAPSQETSPQQQESSAKSVTAIEVIGNKAISTNVIVSKLKTRIGSPYQENVTSDDLKRLYLLGFFSDIKIDTADYKDGIKVIIKVTERPIIEKISFSGMNHITTREEKLKESLESKQGQYLDYPSLAEDVRTLKKMYDKIGYSQAAVDYKVDINKETNAAKIEFSVIEGKRVIIKNIRVAGSKNYPPKRLLRLMKTKQAWFFNPGVLKDEVLKEDIERIKAFYHREGFTDVIVDYQVKIDEKKPFLYIDITIQEGKRYLVGNVLIRGSKDIPEKDILAKLKECVPGKVFSQEALRIDIAAIQGLYFDRGYISAQVQEATSVDPNTSRVDIVYNIAENKVAYVSKIKVRGNIKTKDIVVRRELKIMPGDKFDGEKLKRSKERLENLGFFDDISYDIEDTDSPDKKNLTVDVKETKTGAFSFGGGYSTVEDFVGFVEIEQKNFDWRNFPYFTGAGQDLRFRASFGTLNTGFNLSFTEPWLFDYPVSFGFDAYQERHDRDSDVGYGYGQKITGGDVRLGRELFEYFRADINYRLDSITIEDVNTDSTDDLKKEEGTNKISSSTLVLTYDSRDNIFNTRKGNILSGSFELAGGPFAGDKDYLKFYSRASHYFPLVLNSVLEARLRLGLANAYRGSDSLPIYERFFAGGADTVRGYRERKLGPFDPASKDPLGGEALLIGNLEYTYPLFDFLKVAAFCDTGNVWGEWNKIKASGLKSSFGLGVRIKTPIGPLLLDYGIPLDKEPGEEKRGNGRFHFSMSQGF